MLSMFVLMIWVFLVATTEQFKWWTVDPRLLGFIGVATVVIFVLEQLSFIPRIFKKRAE